jgi:hypothetical protein
MHNPMSRVFVILCWMIASILLAAPDGLAQVPLLPNLKPFPPADVAIVPDGNGGTKLIFATRTWNNGEGPMELVAVEINGIHQVSQRIYDSRGGSQDHVVGQFVHVPGHDHFHFEDYALYTLQKVGATGVAQGSKTSFCLLDNIKVNTGLTRAPKKPVYTSCGILVQGISVGWGDIYGNALVGQSLPFTGPDGDYLLKIQIDPQERLDETNDTIDDNTSCAQLRIANNHTTVQVLGTSCDAPSGGGGGGGGGTAGDVMVTGFEPPQVHAGEGANVTITGFGFTAGMGVSFEDGTGFAPVASNVNVVNANRITAFVTVKRGGNRADPLWDVRVGPVVVRDLFTVVP